MIQYLAYETARQLYDAGVRMETDMAYFQSDNCERDGIPPMFVRDHITEENTPKMRKYPAPALCELLAVMPDELNRESPISELLIMTENLIGYRSYSLGISHYVRYFSPNERVEACARLLLQLVSAGVVSVEEINNQKQL